MTDEIDLDMIRKDMDRLSENIAMGEFDQIREDMNELAKKISKGLEELPRPFVIEFTGTPKSGKTLCVDVVSKFLKRNAIPVYVVTERASVSPISDKKHVYFNTWTGLTSLCQLLEALEKEISVVILDRGIFDTLVWLDFHKRRASLSVEDHENFVRFLTMGLWREKIDLIVALTVDPIQSLAREYQHQLTDLPGQVMKEDTLALYNESLQACLTEYSPLFRQILPIDTTNMSELEGVTQIALQVLRTGDQLVDEEIAVIPRNVLNEHMPLEGIINQSSQIISFMEAIEGEIVWKRRRTVEEDPTFIQLIPAAVIRQGEEILIQETRGEKHGSLTQKTAIWAGGHVRRTDYQDTIGHPTMNFLHGCLKRELQEELHIFRDLVNLPKLPEIILWDNSSEKSLKHVCIMFEYRVRLQRDDFEKREIYETPNKSLFTYFRKIDNQLRKIKNWESWSVMYLSCLHEIDFPKAAIKQGTLL